jgi:hypothetical protein
MAKKRKGGKRATRTGAPATPPAAQPRASESRTAEPRTTEPRTIEPAFWFGFEVSWAKLALVRVVVFGVLAIDAVLQIRHSPRYGAGGFNVAQLPGLDAVGPTRVTHLIAELTTAYLFVLAACGIATRIVLPIATAIYAWLYFGSHLDSYQHHYLVALLLLLACFIPWQRPAGASPRTRVASWALRLVLVQIGIMYLWAAISKMSPAWLDGRTLGDQITGSMRHLADATIGIRRAARVVVGVELVLALTVWIPRAWPVALPLGLLLHVGILATGLEIGVFAWLMIALYLLVVPDRAWIWLAETPPARAVARGAAALALRLDGTAIWPALAIATALGIVLAAICRFDHALVVAVVLGLAMIVGSLVGRRAARRSSVAAIALAQVLAVGTWTAVDRATTVAADYYKFWGAVSRRFADPATAEAVYRRAIDVVPDEAHDHYQLAQLLLARGASDEGLAELHRTHELEPTRARSLVAEARWLAAHGRRPEAITRLGAAKVAEPAEPSVDVALRELSTAGAGAHAADTEDDDSR